MKLLIIAIALLFSSATLAQVQPENMLPEEFATFIENEIDRGLDSNITVFSGYLNKTYDHGAPIENVTVAIEFVHCSLMWRNVHALLTVPNQLTHEMIEAAIWRAIESAKAHIYVASGDPEKVETLMVPTLLQVSIITGNPTVDVNIPNIYTCTALDLAVHIDMQLQGVDVTPPTEWQLEPIPNVNEMLPEPEIGEIRPEYNS